MNIIRGGTDINLFEVTVAVATLFAVFGLIYGFIWPGGPIVWGLIGLRVGSVTGFVINLLTIHYIQHGTSLYWSHLSLLLGRLIHIRHQILY